MKFLHLKQICGLIRTYTVYTSNAEIAKRLGLGEGTLRGYWELSGGEVPDKNAGRFVALVQEIMPIPLDADAALGLLCGSPVVFHNVLLPIGGASWRKLVDNPGRLQILKPPQRAMRFGEVDDQVVLVADDTVLLNKQFRFRGRMRWSGEGFLAAEHRGEWHLIPLEGSQRSFEFRPGDFDVPVSRDGKPRYLRENETPGYYRYFVIGQSGRLSDAVRHQIHRVNPYPQFELDMLASMILQAEPTSRVVLGASLRVTTEDD